MRVWTEGKATANVQLRSGFFGLRPQRRCCHCDQLSYVVKLIS